MEIQKIDLYRSRDFGEVINVTFSFIQHNFRKLFFTLLYICGPFVLLAGISFTFFQPLNVGAARVRVYENSYFSIFGGHIFLTLLAGIVLTAAVYHFIRLAAERDDFELSDVWTNVRGDLLPLLFIYIGALIVIFFATLCLVIPGIYTAIALSILFVVRMAERRGFFEALSRSFKLIAGRWWRTFGLVVVLSIIQYLLSNLAVLPLYIIGSIFDLLNPGQVLVGMDDSPFGIAIQALRTVFSLLCSAILVIALVFHYYSLVEEKEGRGLMAKIGTMGAQPPAIDREEEEQY